MDSLLALQTEVLRKTREGEQSQQDKSRSDHLQFKNQSKSPVLSNLNVKQRVDNEDESDLANSKAMLEAKSSFYDKMQNSKGIGSDGSKRYLVDFESKILEDPSKVESLRKEGSSITFDEAEEIFAPVHYQHMRENEARELGVGYFDFSLDEETRQSQLGMLKDLHKETKAKQNQKDHQEKQRQAALQERLNKIRAKRNLPLVKSDVDCDEKLPLDKDETMEREINNEIEQNRLENKSNALSDKREWDSRKRTLVEVVDEKLKKLRDNRDPDFAPPSFYEDANESSSPKKSCNSIRNVPGTGAFVSSTGNAMKALESMYDNGPKNMKSGLGLPRDGDIAGLVIGDSIQKRVIAENISDYVFVRGFGGAKAKDLSERLSYSPSRQIKHVILSIGLNDALACSQDDLEFRVHFKKCIDLVHQKFCPQVLQIGTLTPTRGDSNHVNVYVERINNLIKALFNEFVYDGTSIQLLDVNAAFQMAIAPICPDGVHPSTEGVMVLVQCYRQQFEASGIEINWDQEVTVRAPPEKERKKF